MKQRRRKAQKRVTTSQLPWGGDHGPATAAATAGTVVEPIDGPNPNRMARRRRKIIINDMLKRKTLTMRQHQAAEAIQLAYLRVQSLSSGTPLKEQVQSSPKPDASVTIQCGAHSRLVHVMRAVKKADRELVETVCWHNKPLRSAIRGGYVRGYQRFRDALDAVADHIDGKK